MAFFASITFLIGCNQKAQIESAETTESLPEKVVSETEASESTFLTIGLIPVAIWTLIDVNQSGTVNANDFVDYYTIKAQEKEQLSGKEAYAKFKNLDQDGDGELTKEEATGEK